MSYTLSLTNLNPRKAAGPDDIGNWLLREYAEILVQPITSILNASFREQRLPAPWKLADVVPLPKQKPVVDATKHLRPISLTPAISKVAEDFVVLKYVGPAVLQIIDPNQYGGIPRSSTLLITICWPERSKPWTCHDGFAFGCWIFCQTGNNVSSCHQTAGQSGA